MRVGACAQEYPSPLRRPIRNAPQKHFWCAEIILLSADGVGTVEIM